MTDESELPRVVDTMRRINEAWLKGRVDDLAPMIHSDVVMELPGFAGRVQGREPFLAGFRDFCEHATVRSFEERDQQVSVVGDVAIVTFRHEMVYEYGGTVSRSTGRDLWVLEKREGAWIAVWRTMLDLEDHAV
jgi:ketosteroid isomerase-like protein